jgi:uncharacterized RDD family membrane protein YckC
VTGASAPAGWYPDPDGSGGQRYWTGSVWTEHRLPPPPPQYYPPQYHPYGSFGPPSWKGAQIGRPAEGPGALAHPGRRLGARALDWLLLLPVFVVLLVIALLIAAPHFGPIFPTFNANDSNTQVATPGILWVYLTVAACAFATGLAMVAYETVATAKFGRTLGKAWLHIRPVRIDGATLGWGRSFGRAAIGWVAAFLGWIGLLDPLWCLWDDKRQCVHDKVADSIVINDLVRVEAGVPTRQAVGANELR